MRKAHHSGFAMIMAIIVMLTVAIIAGAMLSLSTLNVKKTEYSYYKEQAELLAKSAAEYTMLAISGHDRTTNNNCINALTMQYPASGNAAIFDINVTVRYIGFGDASFGANCNTYIGSISTPESNGTVMLDITVETTSNVQLSEQVRYFKRTLQKP